MIGYKFFKFGDEVIIRSILSSMIQIIYHIKRNRFFFLTLVITFVFYYPALRGGAINAGFLYGGDVLGWYLPALAKTHTLIHSFIFTAIDYSTFNGSSDFFLSPNFFAYHPLVVIFSILVPPDSTTMHQLGHFLVLLMVFHSFISFYFTIKLFSRFFSFKFGSAALIATVFTFSVYMVDALGQPPFFFCVSIIPWAIFGIFSYVEKQNLRNFIFACLPIILGFMGGYLPMGVASLALAAVIIIIKILYIDESDLQLEQKLRILLIALLPFVATVIIVGPYLYSVYSFHHETSSAGVVSLFYSAHQLAQPPQSLLKIMSTHFFVPGAMIEFSFAWGLTAIAIASIFLLGDKTVASLNSKESKLFKVAAAIYFATVLATFGDYSVVSDLVFYFVPQVGGMHIYQRFLLPAQLVFAVMLVLMLRAVIHTKPLSVIKKILILFAILTFVIAYLVAYYPTVSQNIGFNNFLIFELFLTFLFLCVLLVTKNNFVYGAAIIIFLLPVLDRMYDYSLRGHTFQEQRKRQIVALDINERAKLIEYFKKYSNKDAIKYVDITPMWSEGGVEYFPKVFPYFELKNIRLSSYGGFTFYLSARADYMRKMPVMGNVEVKPDWELILNTGADFVVALTSDLKKGALGSMLSTIKSEDMHLLSNKVVIIPLKILSEKRNLSNKVLFDNGFFKVNIPTDNKKLQNIANGKSAKQSSTGGGNAMLAVDGNTDGNYSHGSVTHTGQDKNAWFEIDLGNIERIGNVKIWNRTDCCGERLNDYWLFISEQPFLPSDTASILKSRKYTWSQVNLKPNPVSTINTQGILGRYIRVQLDNGQKIENSFLSLAEVEIFQADKLTLNTFQQSNADKIVNKVEFRVNEFTTNFANSIYFNLQTSVPLTVNYLFWDNPRLSYYLNGKPVELVLKNGLYGIDVPVGVSEVEIKYRHWPLFVFWVFYTIYGLLLVWVLLPVRYQALILGIFKKVK